MKSVTCLLSTYGRYSRLCETVACFLAQDHHDRELLILNSHPAPLVFEHPQVRIFNQPANRTLGQNLNLLLRHATGEFVQVWTDDDFYLPWHVSQGIENIGDGAAWKPTRSWFYDGSRKENRACLVGNNMEPSIIWRAEFVHKFGFDEGHREHGTLLSTFPNGVPPNADMGCWATFMFIWGMGEWHLSGSDGNGQSVEQRNRTWRSQNQDTGDSAPLLPVFPTHWSKKIMAEVPADQLLAWRDKMSDLLGAE